jgi:hypothetical protein
MLTLFTAMISAPFVMLRFKSSIQRGAWLPIGTSSTFVIGCRK